MECSGLFSAGPASGPVWAEKGATHVQSKALRNSRMCIPPSGFCVGHRSMVYVCLASASSRLEQFGWKTKTTEDFQGFLNQKPQPPAQSRFGPTGFFFTPARCQVQGLDASCGGVWRMGGTTSATEMDVFHVHSDSATWKWDPFSTCKRKTSSSFRDHAIHFHVMCSSKGTWTQLPSYPATTK